LETVQGEGGLYPADKAFLQEVRQICNERDILMILDEIQCGMGRTGTMMAYEQYGVKPDIVTMAKALGCGVPVGAFVAKEKVAASFVPGDHGSTYGGNPFVAAAVNAVFDIFEKNEVLKNVQDTGTYLIKTLDEIKANHDEIIDRRGLGMMQGLEFDRPVKGVIAKAMDNGLITISAGTNIIRFVPPLVISKKDVDNMAEILDSAIISSRD
jgi:acetylornithine/N-succinyldiaminopimelate aminotransferase